MVDLKLEIPKSFLEEEIREGYLVKKEIKELWAVQMDLLNELERVCKKNNIKYFIMFGTLLGVIRHKGFIPWDDDIDIAITRTEFEKLMKVKDDFKYPYFLQTEDTDKGCHTYYGKLRNSETAAILKPEIENGYKYNRGIFIDLFVIDPVPDDEKEREKFYKKIRKKRMDSFRWARMFDAKKFNSVHRVARMLAPVYKVLGALINAFNIPNLSLKNFDKLARKYEGKGYKYYAELGVGSAGIYNEDWFKDLVYLDFEFMKVPCPTGYEELLEQRYGDWRTPVIGTQVHTMSIVDTGKSYKEYDK